MLSNPNLSAVCKNISLGIMLPMPNLEEIAAKEATRRFEDMAQ